MTRILTIIALLFATPSNAFLINFEMYCATPSDLGKHTLFWYHREPINGDEAYVWVMGGWEPLFMCEAAGKKVKCKNHEIDFSAKKIFLNNGRYINCFSE